MPFPRPETTPPVTNTYFTGIVEPPFCVIHDEKSGIKNNPSIIQPVVKYVSDTFMRIAECTKLGILSPEIYISQIYEIIYNLFSGTPRNVDFCKQVKDYIRFNYMNEITVELIAESMGLSRRYLSRIFKEKYGKPIKSYLISVRCEKAAEFLSIGYTVTEAAVMSGYSDIFAFSKIFHKVMKMSPSEYRKRTYGFEKDV